MMSPFDFCLSGKLLISPSILKENLYFPSVFLVGALFFFQFSSVQSLSRVWLFATPWIAACQASLSITNSRSSLRLASIESVMPSSHLILMYGCESWTVKKAEHQRIDAFELWCWRRLLRVPWTARRSNQFILKKISPEYSLEGLMLKLKLQYFDHLMQIINSL